MSSLTLAQRLWLGRGNVCVCRG